MTERARPTNPKGKRRAVSPSPPVSLTANLRSWRRGSAAQPSCRARGPATSPLPAPIERQPSFSGRYTEGTDGGAVRSTAFTQDWRPNPLSGTQPPCLHGRAACAYRTSCLPPLRSQLRRPGPGPRRPRSAEGAAPADAHRPARRPGAVPGPVAAGTERAGPHMPSSAGSRRCPLRPPPLPAPRRPAGRCARGPANGRHRPLHREGPRPSAGRVPTASGGRRSGRVPSLGVPWGLRPRSRPVPSGKGQRWGVSGVASSGVGWVGGETLPQVLPKTQPEPAFVYREQRDGRASVCFCWGKRAGGREKLFLESMRLVAF